MAYAGSFSGRLSCGAKPPPKAAALPARIPRTSFNSLNTASEIRIYKNCVQMRVKSSCENGDGWRRPDGEAGDINMSETIYKHKNV
jgi:hypothetical protein